MMAKYYAVKVGKVPGIYKTWPECQKMVNGFSGAKYKSFTSYEDAEDYLKEDSFSLKIVDDESKLRDVLNFEYKGQRVFVDGSFNPDTNVYGAGIAFVNADNTFADKYSISGNDPRLAKSRNIAGEVLAASTAIEYAIEKGLSELTIICDYEGIAMWGIEGKDQWKRDTPVAVYYDTRLEYAKQNNLKLYFIWVRGHIGVDGNELVDRLAKDACGIK